MESQAFEVFLSYCQQDEPLRKELETHLALLKRQGVVKLWHDRLLVAGQAWEPEISGHLESADVILLLVTPDFLASEYCFDIELRRAMERHGEGSAVVIPVFGRPCDWKGAPFGRVQGLPKNGGPVSRWDNRDEAWLEVTQGLRAACEALAQRRAQSSDAPTGKPWNVPFERNPFFTGREDTLVELHQALNKRHRAVLGQAISGLGGIGKTQTAVEYAYRHRDDYVAVFWVRAETEHEIFSGFVEIARRLGLPQASALDPREAVEATQRWLAEHDDWLVIFDNADRPELLKSFLPRETRGRVLLTSRASRFGGLGIKRPFEIANLPAEQATTFLLERVCRDIGSDEQTAAAELAKELGFLPLALEQAGAYLEALQERFDVYLQSYRQRKLELLERQAPQTGDYPESVATTWALNFQEVETESPAAADLLRACAFLAPDTIPLELFEEGATKLGPALTDALKNTVENPLALSEVLEPLTRFSLVRRDTAERTVSIHRLVQTVLRSRLDTDQDRAWAERLVEAVAQVFPEKPLFRTWRRCERFSPHFQNIANLIENGHLRTLAAAAFLNSAGWYSCDQAQYTEAQSFLSQGLAIREAVMGPDHPTVATSLNRLGIYHKDLGQFSESERCLKKSLAIRKKSLPPHHLDLAESLFRLGALHYDQARFDDAENRLLEALTIREKSTDRRSPELNAILSALGSIQLDKGRFNEAEELFKRALALTEEDANTDYPALAAILNNLGQTYSHQGRFADALPLFRRSLSIEKASLGPNHPRRATGLNNLALALSNLGRPEEAKPLFLQALDNLRSSLGPSHPNVAFALQNLATFYGNQGRLDQARPLLQRAVAILRRTLGPKHPRTEHARRNLQAVLRAPRGPGRR